MAIKPSGRKVGRAAEAERRSLVLQEYVAIERPNRGDDERFAEELGLSTDSLVRLATAWRRHGDVPTLRGAGVRITTEMRAAALAALTGDVDLSGVGSSRRAEVLRRLDVLRRFLALEAPDASERAAAAAEIGIGAGAFSRLVRAWILHRSPLDVPGAIVPKRPRRKDGAARNRLDRLVAQALSETPERAPGLEVLARLSSLCKAAGLRPPSQSTAYALLRAHRLAARERSG